MNHNKAVRLELDQLLREGMLDGSTHDRLARLYITDRWDWRSLGRWFLIFGAISAAAGAAILLHEVFVFSLAHLAWALLTTAVALFAAGWKLRQRSRHLSSQAAELLGGFALIGLSFVAGMIYSNGSGNWPALLLIDLIVLSSLSYALSNSLLLVLSAVVFFVWFGGKTGYDSNWGSYWFGMSYPLRFLGASLLIGALGVLHLRPECNPLTRWRAFSKVWISFGLFLSEMSLWLLSLFGNFDFFNDYSADERAAFNLLWAMFNLGVVYVGNRRSYRMLTGYGATFFVIQLYTLFFTYVVVYMGWLLSATFAGGSALALAFRMEKLRRNRPAQQ